MPRPTLGRSYAAVEQNTYAIAAHKESSMFYKGTFVQVHTPK